MAEGNPIQTNFTSGEITPSAFGRVDTSKYFNGAEILENFIVLPQGGAMKRPGTKHMHEVKDSSKLTIQRRFEFSTIQAYVIEVGDQYFRFMADQQQIVSGTPVEISTPYLEAELRELKFAQDADTLYITHPNHPPKQLTRTSDTAWTLSDYDYTDGPYLDKDESDTEMRLSSISNTGTLKSTANDFVIGDVGSFVEFRYEGSVQFAEITAFTSVTEVTVSPKLNVIDYKTIDGTAVLQYAAASGSFPDRIRSTKSIWGAETENSYIKADGVWYLTDLHIQEVEEIPEVAGPPKAPAYSVDCIEVASTPTVVTTSGNLTFSDQEITATLTASKNTFTDPQDVGRKIRLDIDSQQIPCTISSVTSATVVEVDLGRPVPIEPTEPDTFLNEAKTVSWRFGAWYDGNYPAVVNFHEARLNFYSTPLEPQKHWTTVSGSKTDFAPTDEESQVLDTSAITRELSSASDTVNKVNWAISGPVLLMGTVGAEWQVKAGSINEPLTPSNYAAKVQTQWGSENISPERIGHAVIFAQRGANILREMIYQFEIDAHKSFNLSYLADHIFRDNGGIIDIAYQRAPFTRIFVVTGNGQLVAITYEKEQDVIAFTRQIIGGSYNSGDAVVESVESVPSEDEGDVIQLVVKRTINGSTVRYIEYITPDFKPLNDQDKDNMIFVDSCFEYSGVATNTITGLSAWEGETLCVVADGSIRPNVTVSSGSITFGGRAATVVKLGYCVIGDLKTLRTDSGSINGTAQGKRKAIHQLVLRFIDTIGFKHGPSFDKLSKVVSFRRTDDVMDSSPPLFTGDKEVDFRGDYETAGQICIRHDQPYPCTILAVIPQLETYK